MSDHEAIAAANPSPDEEPSPSKLDLRVFERALKLPERRPPPIDREHIAAAMAGGGGAASVGAHHEALFMSAAGVDAPLFRDLLGRVESVLEGTVARLEALKDRSRRTDQYRSELTAGEPWSVFDIVQTALFGVVAVAMLMVGWQAMATILQSSGLEAFEDRSRAETFSLVPIAASFIWEALASAFKTDLGRRRFVGFVYLSSVVLGAMWIALFVDFFGAGMAEAAGGELDLGAMFGDEPKKAEEEKSGAGLLIIGLLAESMIAASCWLKIESLVIKHRYSKPVINPHYSVIAGEIAKLAGPQVSAEDIAGRLRSRLQAIEQGCAVYVRQAQDVFALAVAARKNTALVVSALLPKLEESHQLFPNVPSNGNGTHETEKIHDQNGSSLRAERSASSGVSSGTGNVLRDRSSGRDGSSNGEGGL